MLGEDVSQQRVAECSADTSVLSAPGDGVSRIVHMHGMVLDLKECGKYQSSEIMPSKQTIIVQANECFDGGKQEQEESELTQLVLHLIIRLLQQGNAGKQKNNISHILLPSWEVEETAVVLRQNTEWPNLQVHTTQIMLVQIIFYKAKGEG